MLTDEDHLDPVTGARTSPQFRCGVQPGDMPGAVLLRGAAADEARGWTEAGPEAIHAFVRQLVTEGRRVAHLPGVLVHRAEPTPFAPASAAEQRWAGEWPLVSVIVPTKDRVALLRRTLDGVLHRTAYPSVEVIVVDNGSSEPETESYYAELAGDQRVHLLRQPGPFNYAAMNNTGVAAARGGVVVLLNNDMDVIGPDWLRELAQWAMQPGVGACGGMLLYADGTVQHAGIVTGMTGLAGHVFRHAPPGSAGHRDALLRPRNVSAVTGACLAMRRALYQEMGGMDAAELAVSYNDVDLCLRLGAAGYRIVWTPAAALYHLESASRGLDSQPENAERAQREHDTLLRRWGTRLLNDPFYNQNLTLGDESGGLAWPPRTSRPWRTG